MYIIASVGQGNLDNAGSVNSTIFIDAGYVGRYCKTKHIKIDYAKLISELSNSITLVDAFHHNCMPTVSNPPTT